MASTWECAQCRRRVPLSLQECRCGAFRPRAAAGAPSPQGPAGAHDIAGPRFSLRGLPRSVVVLLGVVVLAAVAGVVWTVMAPPQPRPFLPLLGYVDRPAPTPPPTPTPEPKRRVTPLTMGSPEAPPATHAPHPPTP